MPMYTAFCSNFCLANKRLFKAYSNFLAEQAGLTSGNPQLMGIVAVIITSAIYYCTYFHVVPWNIKAFAILLLRQYSVSAIINIHALYFWLLLALLINDLDFVFLLMISLFLSKEIAVYDM